MALIASIIPDRPQADFAAGAASVNGRFVPIGEAAIPITDGGYRRANATS